MNYCRADVVIEVAGSPLNAKPARSLRIFYDRSKQTTAVTESLPQNQGLYMKISYSYYNRIM